MFLILCCCCSEANSCPILCDPMECSMPGLPVLHYLLEFAQTHVHWITDAIQPSHPLLPLLVLLSIFPSIRVFSSELALCIRWLKFWSFSFSRPSLDFVLRGERCCDWNPLSSLPHSTSSLWKWKAVQGPSLEPSWREHPRSLFTHQFSVFGTTETH